MTPPNPDMQSVYFCPDETAPATLHIELPGGIVNIRVGLRDHAGHPVNAVSISPYDESRGGDGTGRVWHLADDGYRLVCQTPDPAAETDPEDDPETDDSDDGDDEADKADEVRGHWSLVTTAPTDDDQDDHIAEQIRYGATHGPICG